MSKILIIDDQIDNLIAIGALLKNLMKDSEVLTSQSGIEGIEITKKELPDTILLDIQMPNMDGFEVCKKLKSDNQTRHIPIIMVTAIYRDSESRVKGLELGADAFLSKPVDGSELIAQINVMLRIKKAEDKLRNEKELLQDLVEERTRELKEAKEKAENSDRLKSIFLANMSHEIRTPMNSIIGFSEILGNPNLTEEKKKKFIGLIQMSSRQLLTVITDIIDISKIDSNQMKVVEVETQLNSLLQEIYENLLNEKNVMRKEKIDLSYLSSLERKDDVIITDKNHLKHILTNLVNNALKFTERGYIRFGYDIQENKIVFFVEDTGIGIKEESKEVIFERFMQEDYKEACRYGGMGLGLAISKGLVKLLKGEIWVKSKKNKGSTFYFSIPYKPVCIIPSDFDEISISSSGCDWSDKSILIVEDDIINYNYLEEILSPTKVQCIYARSGLDAIQICKSDIKIDLILMDIQLPDLDGYETTKKIKELNPTVSIIAQTAYATNGDKQKSFEAGCDDYISKPIDSQLLYSLIRKFF
ncbi:MAG: response regulator [Leptospiraceae bacterium]|nr:response regulator [Leptospiraceae bacterium]